ncbi:MFS transporter [Actinacidiphila bryophytorum]|uniref:Efflux membrane protein n=1 Tax=Actinacidiphila bryophytorum TaxID=1436133 RepID=A0A9W4GZ40_9ACTN|nr:MFS transporter [Actinacidiphila bryophytorum]MBM9434639.1 MFS transporter [Actinacidiphila bryophytorum]MBN6546538.1 MFS transporter [Actinacidiphila bryophytorum]CAG7628362.1 putative efflux membrane protein [Actinacidiphila bryophytorum]
MHETTARRRTLILAICCMSLLIVSLDNTILNVALPSLQKDFHASVSGLQWTIDAYLLVIASLLLLSGSTADRIGRKRVFQTGLALFTAGSLLCSLAPGLGWLIAFRMVQAVGGSMLNPVAMSIITNTFSEPRERARAIGVWGGVVGISMAAGPIVGGALVQSVGWRSIFWINLPIGLAALVLTARFVPESRAPRARRVDPVGQLLVIALLGTLTYGIIEGSGAGWTSPEIVGCFTVAALAAAGLAAYEKRRTDPLIDTRFFRSVPFSGATVIAVCGFAALGGFLFLNTLYLQNERGLSALDAGLYMLPMAAMALVFAPLSGRLVGARGPRLPLVLAGVTMTASGVLFAALDAQSSDALLFTSYVLFGIGFGLVNAPITNTAVSGMPRAQAGVAAAVASTSRQVGQSLGVAVLGAALAAGLHDGAWWIIAGCGAAVLVLGTLTTGRWAKATAARTAELLITPEAEDNRMAVKV